MRMTDVVQDSATLLALEPEQLAPMLLPVLREQCRLSNQNKFNWVNLTMGVRGDYGERGYECAMAVSAALTYLNGLGIVVQDPESHQWGWFMFSARGAQVKTPQDFKHLAAVSLYPRGRLHAEVERLTFSDFVSGDYESAVFKAFKAVEARVRERGGYADSDFGTVMMGKAFASPGGPLTDAQELPAEAEALRNLFSGAIGRFKNPSSHRFVEYSDPAVVVEMLSFASLLMRRLD